MGIMLQPLGLGVRNYGSGLERRREKIQGKKIGSVDSYSLKIISSTCSPCQKIYYIIQKQVILYQLTFSRLGKQASHRPVHWFVPSQMFKLLAFWKWLMTRIIADNGLSLLSPKEDSFLFNSFLFLCCQYRPKDDIVIRVEWPIIGRILV